MPCQHRVAISHTGTPPFPYFLHLTPNISGLLQADMPKRLGPLLLICLALAGQALAHPSGDDQQREQDLPFCDRSFANLKECGADLKQGADECCTLLQEFRAHGCSW
jgi:hypothetical protein